MPRSARKSKSPAARGAVRTVGSEYRPQLDEEDDTEMQEVGQRRWTRVHGQDKTFLPESCWRILALIGLFLAVLMSTAAAVFAILAWTESDEISKTMAKLSNVEDVLSGLGLGGGASGNQTGGL